jgi:hypothetical protein
LSKEIRKARRDFNHRVDSLTLKIVSLNDHLNEAEEVISKINENLKNMDSVRSDSLRKMGAAITESIKSIIYLISGKPQELQGYGTVPQVTVSSLIGEVKFNALYKDIAPGAQEERLLRDASEFITTVLKKGNDLFEGRWKLYRSYYEATPVKLFKDYKPIN